jgi:hypothetical protein
MARARRRCARPGGRQRALGRDATYLARGRAGDAARPALPSAAVVSPGILVVAARPLPPRDSRGRFCRRPPVPLPDDVLAQLEFKWLKVGRVFVPVKRSVLDAYTETFSWTIRPRRKG